MATYDAFVSYSHAKDKPVAAALQGVIQTLGKPWYRRRALRLFRDDTSLSATPALWPSIEQALSQSRFLILLASPEAAASPWVDKEVAYWLANKGADTLLMALTDGTLAWDAAAGDFASAGGPLPLPPALAGRFAAEPKWVDLRAYRDQLDPRDSRFIEAGADFAAAIHGQPKEDLLSQELRQQRRALRQAWAAAVVLLLLAGAAGWQWWEAAVQRREATAQRDHAQRNFAIAKRAADDVVYRIAQGLRDVQGMRRETVRQILETAKVLLDELVRATPDDLALQDSRAVMLHEFSQTYIAVGDLVRAAESVKEGLAVIEGLSPAARALPERRRNHSILLTTLGDVYRHEGESAKALMAYRQGLAIIQELVRAEPNELRWQVRIGISLNRIGDMLLALGEREQATAAYRESLDLARRLAAAAPDDVQRQRDVSVALNRLGDALEPTDPQAALKAYQEGLTIVRALAERRPDDLVLRRDLTISLNRIGAVYRTLRDAENALSVFQESMQILRQLVLMDPGHGEWQANLATSLGNIGDVRVLMKDLPLARIAYEEALAVARKLAAAYPGNADYQGTLAVSLRNLSDLLARLGDRKGALAANEESLQILRKLAAADASNIHRQDAVSERLERIVWYLHTMDRDAAAAAARESLALRRRILAADNSPRRAAELAVTLYLTSLVTDRVEAQAALEEAQAIVERLVRDKRLLPAFQQLPELLKGRLAALAAPSPAR
ncbi:MAG: tetratricopeptide repeat protein [Hyphomicrobiales bacterium]|nr:tetratricopeptide repeat protein [Hyphomicrobiales bacterium]